MKKYIFITLLIATTTFLISCWWDESQNTPPPQDNSASQDNQIPVTDSNADTQTQADSWGSDNAKSSFDSLNEAVSKWISLKCLYTDTDKSVTNLYIKWDSVFIEWASENKQWNVSGIIKWDTMYMWDQSSGFKLNLSTSPKDSIKIWSQSIKSEQDLLDIVNSQKDNCTQEEIEDSKFEIPSNIEFKELKDISNTENN